MINQFIVKIIRRLIDKENCCKISSRRSNGALNQTRLDKEVNVNTSSMHETNLNVRYRGTPNVFHIKCYITKEIVFWMWWIICFPAPIHHGRDDNLEKRGIQCVSVEGCS